MLDACSKILASKSIDLSHEIWQMEYAQEWKKMVSTAMVLIVWYVHCTKEKTLPCRWHFLGNRTQPLMVQMEM